MPLLLKLLHQRLLTWSQHARGGISIKLQDITSIERDDTRACCLVLETSLHKRYLLSFDTDNELYNWQDAIYSRSGLAGISNPVNFMHNIHIGIDGVSGDFTVSNGNCRLFIYI